MHYKKKKQNVKTTLQIHSQAKVDFYAEYLQRYLMILNLSPYIKKINIYDVFCGMGIFDDGRKGSPIIAYDIVKEASRTTKLKHITLTINDINKDNITIIKNYISRDTERACEVKYFNEDIEIMFSKVIEETNYCNSDCRNLIFIDPYGYKNIKKETIYKLLQNLKTEIILFLPISHMHRFTQKAVKDDIGRQYRPLRNFVFSFFNENHPIRSDKVTVNEYISYIKIALRFNNEFYTTSYHIQRDATNKFALFFISHHLFGFEKILEVKWKLDEIYGNGFRKPQTPGFFDEQFKKDDKIANKSKIKSVILEILEAPKTNIDLYLLLLKEYEYSVLLITGALTELQNDDLIEVFDIINAKPARKKSFYIGWTNYKNHQPPKVRISRKIQNENN